MAKCPKCGVEVADGAMFCPACGAPVSGETADKKEEFKEKVEEAASEVKEKASAFVADVKEKFEEAKAAAAADDNDVYEEQDIKNNKVYAILAYFGILVLIPIFAAKESKFARFHANQGLNLFICYLVAYVISMIPVIKYFAWIIELFLFVLFIMGLVNACKGECKELPLIGKFRFLK